MVKIKNINKHILTAGTVGALLFSGSFIYAQDARYSSRKSQAGQQVQEIQKQAQEQVKQARDSVMQKISQIRNQKKQEEAKKITSQLSHVNQVWTDHFTNVLDKLDTILKKIKFRHEKAVLNSLNVSSVNAAIQDAEGKMAAARTSVAEQAKKTYVVDATAITATSQNNLVSQFRTQFKTLRDKLFKDLTLLRDGTMKDARTAVKNAAQTLSQVPNVDKEPSANSK